MIAQGLQQRGGLGDVDVARGAVHCECDAHVSSPIGPPSDSIAVHPTQLGRTEEIMTISRRQIGAVAFLVTGASAISALAETNDDAGVAESVSALTKAMLGADRAKLESLVSDKLSYGHSGGVVQDKK